jgi:hypothetical protein
MNKTLPNPYYLFSFQHIASKERYSFIPQTIVSNTRYDKFRFAEGFPTNLNLTPPQVHFEYLGQYYYSIYEQVSSANTDPSLAYNKLESGRAVVIIGNDNLEECYFEPYISDDENFAQVIYVSDDETICVPSVTPSNTPTNTPTPSVTPTLTPTPSITPTETPTSTPTPSPTGIPVNPDDLNALWWIDFTDASTITIAPFSNNIQVAVDKINGVNFSQFFGSTGPSYNPTGYLSVSGTAQEFINPLQGSNGLYTQNYSGMTWFGYVYDDLVSQLGGNIFIMSSNSPSSSMLGFINTANIPNTWRSFVDTSAGPINVDVDITYSAWTAIAIRAWEESGNVYLETWQNGSIIGQTNVAGTLITPTNIVSMNLMWGGGVDLNTEQSFFDRKLSDSEMGQMFSYFNTKY